MDLGLRRGIIGVTLLAFLILAGCSALQLGYRQAPNLAHWWLDGYVDFDETQSQRVRQALGEWHGWHRQTQLASYTEHLALGRRLAAGEVSAEQLCAWNDTARALLQPAIERALPAAAGVVLTLTPQQLGNIEAHYRKRTQKLRGELLPADGDARFRAALKRNVDRMDDFYGSTTAEQRRLLEDGLRQSLVDTATWMDQRDRRHREMMDTLAELAREQPDVAQAQQRLRQVVERFNGRAPVGGRAQSEAYAKATCELMARLHNASTPAQRQHLARKLRTWEDDLRAVMPQSVAGSPSGGVADGAGGAGAVSPRASSRVTAQALRDSAAQATAR